MATPNWDYAISNEVFVYKMYLSLNKIGFEMGFLGGKVNLFILKFAQIS